MYMLRSWTAALCIVATATADSSGQRRMTQTNDLSVNLSPILGGKQTEIEAILTNTGNKDLSLLKPGTILSNLPVEKLTVIDGKGIKVPFFGIELSLDVEALTADDYLQLLTGSSVSRKIDLATVHDFEPGSYMVFAEGILPSKTGLVTYKSSNLSMAITTASTAGLRSRWTKRTILDTDKCTPERRKATLDAVQNCEPLARAAAADARDGQSRRFVEYFKSNDTSARHHVSGRLLDVAEQCSSLDKGVTHVRCHDPIGYCDSEGPLIAYTISSNGYVTLCDMFFDSRPAMPEICHKQDHATTIIHEMTHVEDVYPLEVSTQDYAYGYENVTALDPLSCLYNADSYSLYANAVYLNC